MVPIIELGNPPSTDLWPFDLKTKSGDLCHKMHYTDNTLVKIHECCCGHCRKQWWMKRRQDDCGRGIDVSSETSNVCCRMAGEFTNAPVHRWALSVDVRATASVALCPEHAQTVVALRRPSRLTVPLQTLVQCSASAHAGAHNDNTLHGICLFGDFVTSPDTARL